MGEHAGRSGAAGCPEASRPRTGRGDLGETTRTGGAWDPWRRDGSAGAPASAAGVRMVNRRPRHPTAQRRGEARTSNVYRK